MRRSCHARHTLAKTPPGAQMRYHGPVSWGCQTPSSIPLFILACCCCRFLSCASSIPQDIGACVTGLAGHPLDALLHVPLPIPALAAARVPAVTPVRGPVAAQVTLRIDLAELDVELVRRMMGLGVTIVVPRGGHGRAGGAGTRRGIVMVAMVASGGGEAVEAEGGEEGVLLVVRRRGCAIAVAIGGAGRGGAAGTHCLASRGGDGVAAGAMVAGARAVAAGAEPVVGAGAGEGARRDLLCNEGADREEDDDGGGDEGLRLEILERAPFEAREDGVGLTRDNHEDTVGHDEHLHRGESPHRGQDPPVGDEVADELEVEEGAEPKDGDGEGDEGALDGPLIAGSGCQEVDVSAGLNDEEADAKGDSDEDNDARGEDEEGTDRFGPEANRGPGLVHEGCLDDEDKQARHDVAGDAVGDELARDVGVVAGKGLVEVVERRHEEGDEDGVANDARRQAKGVEHRRHAPQLDERTRHGEEHQQRDDAAADLDRVVDGDGDGRVVEGVYLGDGHRNGRHAVRAQEGDVLRVRVEGRAVTARRLRGRHVAGGGKRVWCGEKRNGGGLRCSLVGTRGPK
ncbi:hypothetical protein VFPBJ_11344 [Purpureocillium lilacinum]|uniref:Uncharacterized protein n=1 Tax=Purpureocillium lilacinum TaxID=33203 RepID=A0A179FE30_PURLI|nr:hypothetical protein VFPBJ_11344 [Purpureocillium lilacinum]